jgi:membrane protein insertase Oxa1/YidC/SpoIIIJ
MTGGFHGEKNEHVRPIWGILILNVLILLFAIYLPSSILIYWISGTCFFMIIEFLWLKEKHIKQFETGNIFVDNL